MAVEQYEVGGRRLTPAERARELQRIEQERQREAERERERLAQEAQARQAREAALAARPPGAHLVEARCGVCHPANHFYFAANGQTKLGWWLTVLRMQVLNGARIRYGEHALIVDYLAVTYPAPAGRRAAEWAAAAALGAVTFALCWRILFRRAARRRFPAIL